MPFLTVQVVREDRLIRTQKKSPTMLLIELFAEREASLTLFGESRGSCAIPPIVLSILLFQRFYMSGINI